MRIISLKSENVKRLTAVNITPGETDLITIGGKNGAGKSSVLDSIMYALGGTAAVPTEPIRKGEAEARVELDLGEIVVTRRFKRDRLPCSCPDKGAAVHQDGCDWHKFGPTNSTLIVANKEGARYTSPQAVLDKLLGDYTFDPLAFSRLTPKKQQETLRELAGLDTSALDEQRINAVRRRSQFKQQRDDADAVYQQHKHYPDEKATEEVSIEAVSQEMLKAEEYRKLAEDAERAVAQVETRVRESAAKRDDAARLVKDLEKQLEHARAKVVDFTGVLDDAVRDLDAKKITAEAARVVVPDTAVIREKITAAEALNVRVRANKQHAEQRAKVDELHHKFGLENVTITSIDANKQHMLENAVFPVPGLGLNDDGVTFNGNPFEQASSSEQVRVSVAIGLALNPRLKVLLVRNGNMLDNDSLKLVAEQAEAADAQIWVEYVTANEEGVSVMIEDGHVA